MNDLTITDAAFPFLAGLESLEHLNLRSCDQIVGRGFEVLVGLRVLVAMQCKKLKDDGLRHLSACTLQEALPRARIEWGYTVEDAQQALQEYWDRQ